jgi:hypothetical protein
MPPGAAQHFAQALILMGDWCAVCAANNREPVRKSAEDKGLSRKGNAWAAQNFARPY